MFGANLFLVPGQELKKFYFSIPDRTESIRGRVTTKGHIRQGCFNAVLAQAKQEERDRWRQSGHPVTHKIIQQGITDFPIVAGDVLEYNNRKFYIQGIYNPAELNHWIIYYCHERNDIT